MMNIKRQITVNTFWMKESSTTAFLLITDMAFSITANGKWK